MNDDTVILRAARDLLSDETRWCKLSPGRDRSGNHCYKEADVFSRCLLASINKSKRDLGMVEAHPEKYLVAAIMEITGADEMRVSILGFNDNSDHATVLRALDRAAVLAGAA